MYSKLPSNTRIRWTPLEESNGQTQRIAKRKPGRPQGLRVSAGYPKSQNVTFFRFAFEHDTDGIIKARLAVQGHAREPGIDYGNAFALVCKIGREHTLLAIAWEHGRPVF